MLAIVLDQLPRPGPGRTLAIEAEGKLREAGIETLDSEAYYRQYDGSNFRVSRWENHPNEKANAIWASMLADAIRQHPDVSRSRSTSAPPGNPSR